MDPSRRPSKVDMSDVQPARPANTEGALKWTIFLGVTAVVIYLCLQILIPFLSILGWSAVLAITFHPLHRYFVRLTGRVTLSAVACSAVVVVAFLIPLLFMAGLAVSQFLALGDSLQRTFTDESGIDTTTPVGQAYDWITRRLGLDAAAIVSWIRQHATELTRVIAQYAVAIAASVTGAVLSFVFVIFAMFLLFRDGERIVARIPARLPFEPSRSEALLLRIRDVVYGGVYGVVVIALLQGALCGVMFWILRIPSAALWGMVTVLTSVLPIVGAAAVWVPGAVYLLTIGEWAKAIVLAGWGTTVVSGVDNFLRPRLVGGRVGLSELVMFFALLGGLRVFGILGIVLGPVLFAIVGAIVDVLTDTDKAALSTIRPIDTSKPL
jgi:predicted PurR-regulated permease PerM